MDAVTVIVQGLNNMLLIDPDVFRNTFRRGQVYNNGTRGIQCKSDPPIPWKHGPAIMKSFRKVSAYGWCLLTNNLYGNLLSVHTKELSSD